MPSYLADLMVRGISKRKLRRKRRARKLAIYRRLKNRLHLKSGTDGRQRSQWKLGLWNVRR